MLEMYRGFMKEKWKRSACDPSNAHRAAIPKRISEEHPVRLFDSDNRVVGNPVETSSMTGVWYFIIFIA